MVSQQLLDELKVIIKEDYGITLKPEELSDVANQLVNFFDLLIKINREVS